MSPGSNYATSSIILPSIHKLRDFFNDFKCESDNSTIQNLAFKLDINFDERTRPYFKTKELYGSTYLDPRLRSIKY